LVDAEVNGEEQTVLIALVPIAAGAPFAIAVSADEKDEYEQWELDTSTGEMVRVEP
jgi:hypothetical protein